MKKSLARWLLIMSSGCLITACQNDSGNRGGDDKPTPSPQKPVAEGKLCNQAQQCLNEQDLQTIGLRMKKAPSALTGADLIRWQAIQLARTYESIFNARLGDERLEFTVELYNKILGKE